GFFSGFQLLSVVFAWLELDLRDLPITAQRQDLLFHPLLQAVLVDRADRAFAVSVVRAAVGTPPVLPGSSPGKVQSVTALRAERHPEQHRGCVPSPLIWLFSGVKLCLKPVPGFAVDQWRAELNRLAVFVDDFRFTSLPAWQLRPVRGGPDNCGVPELGRQLLRQRSG